MIFWTVAGLVRLDSIAVGIGHMSHGKTLKDGRGEKKATAHTFRKRQVVVCYNRVSFRMRLECASARLTAEFSI